MVKIVVNFQVVLGLIVGIGGSLPNLSRAWSPSSRIGINRAATVALSSMASDDEASSSRREALHQTLTNTLSMIATVTTISGSSTLLISPEPAYADVTNKIASSTALRALTRAQVQLPIKLLPEAQKNNFVGIKARLREPPFDSLRKTMLVLVRGGEDGPKASELQVAYKQLIAALEAIDATASLGYQGRDVDPFRLGEEYEDIVKAFDAFVQLGTEAASIPLQN